MDKVYLAELDVHTAKLVSKIDQATKMSVEASGKMTAAFGKINTAMEKDFKSSSIAMSNFSKRDLGMLANQMLMTAGSTGKLTGQLSNLATGLLTGGFIGGAFAGFAAILNLTTEKAEDLKKVMGEIIKINTTSGAFNVDPEKIPEAIALLKDELGELEKQQLPGFQGYVWGSGQRDALKAAIETLQTFQNEYSEKQKIIGTLQKAGLTYTIEEKKGKEKTLEANQGITAEMQLQMQMIEDIYQRMKEMDDEDLILGDVTPFGSLLKGGGKKEAFKPKWDDFYKHIEKAQDPMVGLVSLSNQMASNFSFAGHTFVGQLSQAISMVDSISNMILTVASIFGGGGGFGIGGLLSLIGLEKGGRVSNRFGSLSHTRIPSFAMGGSYSTPSYAGPMAGGYPVMVHKNETLDVYNAGQTSRMEKTLNRMANLLYTNGLHTSAIRSNTRGLADGPIVINLDGKKLFEVVTRRTNRAERAGVNLSQF